MADEMEFLFDSEPIEAWRIWKVKPAIDEIGDDLGDFVRAMADAWTTHPENPFEALTQHRLCAVGSNGIWPARRRFTAFCNNHRDHLAPSKGCECGIWALKSEALAHETLVDYGVTSETSVGYAYGRIYLWGRFVELKKGWRAQYAYPAELRLVNGDPKLAETLGDLYGVPTVAEPLPDGVRDLIAARKAARPPMQAGGLMQFISTNMASSIYAMPPRMQVVWNEDALIPVTNWPSGIARPSEFWDAANLATAPAAIEIAHELPRGAT